MADYKRTGQIESLIEYNVYGNPGDKEPMIIGRVVTVSNVRAGFEEVATFKNNDDGAQYAAYVDELKLRAARYDMILDYYKKSEMVNLNNLLKRLVDPK